MENLDKVFERINKLFALAKRGGTEAEAQNALLRARELMLRHNISEADLPTQEEQKRTLARNTLEAWSQKWMTMISNAIASYYRCQMVMNSVTHRLVIIGLKEDVEIFTPILAFTFESFIRCFKKRLKEDENYQNMTTHQKHTHYNVFLDTYTLGYVAALKQKLEEQNLVLSQCKDLVITTPQEVQDYIKNSCRVSKSRSIMRRAAYTDYERQGFVDGMTNSDKLHKNISYEKEAA